MKENTFDSARWKGNLAEVATPLRYPAGAIDGFRAVQSSDMQAYTLEYCVNINLSLCGDPF
jgi:hypothetical protein